MLSWIQDNAANIIISLTILAVMAAIITKMVRNKKRGRSATCMGCSGCPSAGMCKDAEKEPET